MLLCTTALAGDGLRARLELLTMQHRTHRIKAQTSLDLMVKKTCTYTVKHWPLSDNTHSYTQNRNNGLPDAVRLASCVSLVAHVYSRCGHWRTGADRVSQQLQCELHERII